MKEGEKKERQETLLIKGSYLSFKLKHSFTKGRQPRILQFLLQFSVQDFGDVVLLLALQVVKFTTTHAHYIKSRQKGKERITDKSYVYFFPKLIMTL